MSMSKKNYEAAAEIVQAMIGVAEASQDIREAACARGAREAFVRLFSDDSPRFDVERFRAACTPGANVRARGRR